jgi:hypothetical protein
MIPPGHVGGQAVEMLGFNWRSLKDWGYMVAIVLDRITALKSILKKQDVAYVVVRSDSWEKKNLLIENTALNGPLHKMR